MWKNLSQSEKLALVKQLNQSRLALADQARAKREAAYTSTKRKKKLEPLLFASEEHKRAYYSLSEEARKLIFGA